MKKMIPLLTILILSTTICGCSVYMAARQPDKKDVQLFNLGTPRSQVLAEFGVPAKTSIEAARFVTPLFSGRVMEKVQNGPEGFSPP